MHRDPALQRAKKLGLYERVRTPHWVKLKAVRTYLAGASLRGTAWALKDLWAFSHEAVRLWVQRLAHLFPRHAARHDLVVIDETSVFLRDGSEVFVWAALDGETQESLGTWVSQGRSGLEAYLFAQAVVDRCTGRPRIVVDRGVWYPWALDRVDAEWEVVSGGVRSLVGSYFGSLKARLEKMESGHGTWHSRETLAGVVRMHGWMGNERCVTA